MDEVLAREPEEVQEAYVQARTKDHRERLDAIVAPLLDKHGLRLRFDEVVHHDDFTEPGQNIHGPQAQPTARQS
ncbi:hypothetical protein ACFY9S_10915 [Streptomyces sp. NPDC012474]|uniref:hypothetical protein n=1 Tax=Streptomyces sp. NPDC012474 TaxID=3364836 RepID=UPI0036E75940